MLSDVIYFLCDVIFAVKLPVLLIFIIFTKWQADLWYEFITYFTGKNKKNSSSTTHKDFTWLLKESSPESFSTQTDSKNRQLTFSFLVIFYFGLIIAVIFLLCPVNCCNHHGLVRLFPWENNCSLFFPVEFLEWKHHFTVSNVMCFKGRN